MWGGALADIGLAVLHSDVSGTGDFQRTTGALKNMHAYECVCLSNREFAYGGSLLLTNLSDVNSHFIVGQ